MGLVKIVFPDSVSEELRKGNVNINGLLNDLLFSSDNRTAILTQLNNYHSDEDGAPIVSEFTIAGTTYNADTSTGQVRLAYHVNFTFACADKTATTNHFETSDFTIDPENQTLSLFIHDKISRDTYEEF